MYYLTLGNAGLRVTTLLLLSLFVGEVRGEEAVGRKLLATNSDATSTSKVAPASYGNLDAQITDTLYQLTRARLERVMRANAEVPGTVAADDVAAIEGELAAISEQQGINGEVLDWFSTLIGIAEVTKTSAESDWKRVSILQQESPQSITELDAEMVRLRARLAALNLQRGRLAAKGSADDRENWALQYLSMETQDLRDRVRRLEVRE